MQYYDSRNSAVDVSLSIPAPTAASMETTVTMSEERIAAGADVFMMPPIRPIALPVSSSSPGKIMPLRFENEMPGRSSVRPPPNSFFARRVAVPLVKKVAAELLGTFLLVFTVASAATADAAQGALGPLGVATAAGLAVLVLVSSLAHVSGGHLNPAVSVAAAAFGRLPLAHLAPYVAAQLLGSTTASFAAAALYYAQPAAATSNGGLTAASTAPIATVPKVGAAEAFSVEFVTTFAFLFVVTALSTDPKAANQLVAVGAGAAVTMSALISGESTGASMNPARTLGAAIATGTYTKIWVYMVAPPLGAIAGAGAYAAIK